MRHFKLGTVFAYLGILTLANCSHDIDELPDTWEEYAEKNELLSSGSSAVIGSTSSSNGTGGNSSSSSSSSSSVVQNSSSSVASSSSGASSSSSSSSNDWVSSSSSTTQSNSSSSVIDVGSCDGFDPNAEVEHYGKMKKQICDERDGKKYVYVKIGTQTWMAENLNYVAEGSKCYTDNKNPDETANCKKYGRFYDWAAAMGLPSTYNSILYESEAKHRGICPSGWHIPSNEDWDKLFSFVDGNTGTGNPYNSPTAGRHLKAISGWYDCDPSGGSNNDRFCEDTHGFSALPGGPNNGYFTTVGYNGHWLSSSEGGNDYAYHRYMVWSVEYTDWSYGSKSFLFSVRCVED